MMNPIDPGLSPSEFFSLNKSPRIIAWEKINKWQAVYISDGDGKAYAIDYTPDTSVLLDYWFRTTDLRNYARHCERGEIRYSRDTNKFSEKEHQEESFRQFKVSSIDDMKAHIWDMDESEL